MTWQSQLKFGIEGAHPREFVQKISCVSVQGVLSYRCVKMSFSSFLYNTHLSVACPGFLGPHYHVS